MRQSLLRPIVNSLDGLDARPYHRRMSYALGLRVSLCLVVLACLYQLTQPLTWVLAINLVLLVLLTASLVLLDRRGSVWLIRAAALGLICSTSASLFLNSFWPSLLWVGVAPLLLFTRFNWLESLIWSLGVLAPGLVYIATSYEPVVMSSATLVILTFLLCLVALSIAVLYRSLFQRSHREAEIRGASLLSQQKRFKEFSSLASDWLFELDAKLNISYVSENVMQQIQETLGHQQSEDSMELVLAACVDGRDALMDVLRARQSARNLRLEFKFDQVRPVVSLSLRPIYEEGVFQGYRGVATDVTNIEQASVQIREQERVLYHAQKMEAVGQLTSGIAHDFNNLLTVIRGNLEIFQLDHPQDPPNVQLQEAMRASESASQLTANMLAFARRQPLQPQATDAYQLIESMQPILRQSLNESISVELSAQTGLWLCLVDPVQLESALLNLAINARDAMPSGGKLTIHLSNEQVVGHKELRDGDYVCIQVADNGVGIDNSIQEMVFDPFFSTKPQGVGSGLGLSMVYGFVRQSEGAIEIASELGEGAQISLWLPRGLDALRVDAPKVDLEHRPESMRIVVVEDDAGVRALVSAMLNIMGHRATVLEGVARAHAEIETNDIDLLITDVVLANGESGLELAREVRRKHPELPILFISGYAQPLADANFQLDDNMALLSKPFGVTALTGAINKLAPAPC